MKPRGQPGGSAPAAGSTAPRAFLAGRPGGVRVGGAPRRGLLARSGPRRRASSRFIQSEVGICQKSRMLHGFWMPSRHGANNALPLSQVKEGENANP